MLNARKGVHQEARQEEDDQQATERTAQSDDRETQGGE